jgi:hypothetical protein
MQNLRIVSVDVTSSTTIDVVFTSSLTTNLVTSNVKINPDGLNTPIPEVLQLKILGATLSITCQPLTPFAVYNLEFISLTNHKFTSINGDAIIVEDGISNKYLINGPLESDNPVSNYLKSYFHDNIYNFDDPNTLVSKYLNALSTVLSKALYDIKQSVNENYLTHTIIDEQKIRSDGPFDRLNEESAYEIIRVGTSPTQAKVTLTDSYDFFGSSPVTLQKQVNTEVLSIDSVDELGKFNINNLILNLSNQPVTKLVSLTFVQSALVPEYVYDINALGYQINNSRYDQSYASTYVTLGDNQIKLNDRILQDSNFSIHSLVRVEAKYESKDLGRVIDDTSVQVYTDLKSIREVLPPIINIFNLQHAPIIDSSGAISTIGGVIFTDANNPTLSHSAFATEIPFRINSLPAMPGQYSIDYATGTVYVYGSDISRDGTGPFPPVATYNYKFNYKSEIDFVYDSDLKEIVALPLGSLLDFPGTIEFNYERVLVPDTDYSAALHTEILTERVGNNQVALNAFKTAKSPITNVFRIYNETTGEIYSLTRWNDNKIYYSYHNPPNIKSTTGERASFNDVVNEVLFVNSTLVNLSSTKIFKILLKNNTIVSASEDTIGFAFNTSVFFSYSNVFKSERWFDRDQNESSNINRLVDVGDYMIDYSNGIVYCAVSSTQGSDIGTISYKNDIIVPKSAHIISVEDIFYRINALSNKNKSFSYTSFDEGQIIPEVLEYSDELTLNNSTTNYQLYNSNVGVFLDSGFIAGITNQIKSVRGLYEYQDLLNNLHPINFSVSSTSSGFNISVGTITKQSFDVVAYDGTNYFIVLNENFTSLSPNITYSVSVVRTSDSAQLWDNSGVIVPGESVKLVLSGVNSPNVGDLVSVVYSFTINNLSRVIVDYNRGDLFVDYTYVADEIIVSYEYGDNVIDFRKNKNLPAGTTYYVSYKVGALRDALLKNFGTLINIPQLTNFDIDFDRERYRDALYAALSSFIKGPTITAMKNIGQTISHIEPVISESVFQGWTLGTSLLTPEQITTNGSFELVPGKFGNGVLVNSNSQSIQFPVNSNIRIEEGTFEEWIIPQWNGLDNDASLTFNIIRNNLPINPLQIFIGSEEAHPNSNIFSISKESVSFGKPNTNKDGVFIYYDKDPSGLFNRWFIEVLDGYVTTAGNYKIKINTDGKIYDSKSFNLPTPPNVHILTTTSGVTLTINSIPLINEGITFIADVEHYLLDFGQDKSKSRLSIYKDVSGYLNFRVYDKDQSSYHISADVSAWKIGDPHFVAASWKLNTINNKDEMHLFIDGFEVPNIIKYGQNLSPFLHEKYRTVDPEEIVGLITADIVGSVDLVTSVGSSVVTSSINFSAYNISSGDTIFIDETGFSPSGYTISSISGQSLTLSSVMPLSITNGRFSVNRTAINVSSEIDIATNITVSTISSALNNNDLFTVAGTNVVTSSGTNFSTNNVLPGYSLRIDAPGLQKIFTIVQVSGTSLTLLDNVTLSLSNATYHIYPNTEKEIPGMRAVRPSYSVSKDVNNNNLLVLSNNIYANDLVILRTLGLNFRKIKRQYYVWADGYENVLMTRMPAPISLDAVNINKIILPPTLISSSNSTYSGGVFYSDNLPASQPISSTTGRTLSATINGSNTDFSTPVHVTIHGIVGATTVTETILFTNYGTLNFANSYSYVNYISVIAKPINVLRGALSVTIKEKYPVTHNESSLIYPTIQYSYVINAGYDLYSSGSAQVSDNSKLFSEFVNGNYLFITSPGAAAGYYKITGVSADRKSLYLDRNVPVFINGVYQILNVSSYRSGLQNGFFTLEQANAPGKPFYLSAGFYDIEYFTYTSIRMNPQNNTRAHLGHDMFGNNNANCVIDETYLYSTMLTDTRVGETIPANQKSITKNFNSLKTVAKDSNTLMMLDFETFPFVNQADHYVRVGEIKNQFESSLAVNDNFGNSLVLLDEPIIVSNDGILDTRKEGTIEFWTSPLFDTGNDPNNRFYFDAYGAVTETVTSINNVSVKISSPAGKILKVVLAAGDPTLDYFAGGNLEIDTQNAIQEEGTSITNSMVVVSKPALQIISVKIVGDFSEKDYFGSGSIGDDRKTIYLGNTLPQNTLLLEVTYQPIENKNKLNSQIIRLGRKLPSQNSVVKVTYLPKGIQGDRISIYKDEFGYINFGVSASGKDFVVRAPTRWVKGTWHRVKASYKFNGGLGQDEMRLFVDGYEYTASVFGSSLLFGDFPILFGSSTTGDGYVITDNIRFKDPINQLVIGAQYNQSYPVFSLLDNFRISNISRPLYAPYGESIDVNYSSNIDMNFPVTPDLYTTYLLDFSESVVKVNDFTTLKNSANGNFDFSINILDSFGIVNSSTKVQEVLEKLIKTLKPANSRVFIQYTR